MENVINFPTKAVRDWTTLERALNETFDKAKASDSVKQRITERMKAFWEMLDPKMDLSFDVPFKTPVDAASMHEILSSISDTIGNKCSISLQAFTHSLFIERLQREVDACGELGLLR